jgi:DHA1 family bicyclomycin/chloramphenicol resistance-like MFS transporter
MTRAPSSSRPAAPEQPTGELGAGRPVTARPVQPTGRRYLQLVLVLGALIALGPLTVDMYLPAFPSMAEDLAASDSAVQLTLTGMLGGLAVGQLVIGPLSDAFGRRLPLLVGLVTHAAASLLCAIAPSILLLSGVRVIQGFAGAALSVVAMATVRDLFSGVEVARLMSRLMLVIGLAPILAPSIGGLILEWTDWRGIFVVLAASALVLVVVAVLGLQETLPRERRRAVGIRPTLLTYRSLFRDTTFVALVFIGGLMFSSLFIYVSGASFVLQGVYGLNEHEFGLVFGANAATLTVFSQVNPMLLRRFGPANVLTGAIVFAAVAATLLLVTGATGWGGLVGVLVAFAMVLGAAGLALPNTPALAMTRHGEAAGTAAALLGCVQFGVGAVVAPLVGLLGTESAVPMGAVTLTVTLLALVLMTSVVRRDETVTSMR